MTARPQWDAQAQLDPADKLLQAIAQLEAREAARRRFIAFCAGQAGRLVDGNVLAEQARALM